MDLKKHGTDSVFLTITENLTFLTALFEAVKDAIAGSTKLYLFKKLPLIFAVLQRA